MTEQLAPPQERLVLGRLAVTASWTAADESLLRPAPLARPDQALRRFFAALTAFHSSTGAATAVADAAALTMVTTLAHVDAAVQFGFPAAVIAAGYISKLYADRDTVQTRGILWYPRLVAAPLVTGALVVDAASVVTLAQAARLAVVALLALTTLRALSWLFLVIGRRHGRGLRPTLLIGAPEATATVQRRLAEFPEAGLAPTRVLTTAAAHLEGAVDRELRAGDIRHVVLVAPEAADRPLVAQLPRHAADAPYFSAVPALAELFVDPHSLVEVGGIPLIPLGRPTLRRHRFPGKRAFDLLVSTLLLTLAAPVMALVAAAVKLQDGGPVLYRQQRTGRNGRVFRIVKFRTMIVGADEQQRELATLNVTDGLLFKVRHDPRVTPLGRLLRRTALDELPQLWNVVRGDMSMVGPRPLAADPADFGPAESERHSVQPGITGYWQLSGGNELSYDEMVRLDLAYIRNWSLWLDVRLVLRTVPSLLNRHGAA